MNKRLIIFCFFIIFIVNVNVVYALTDDYLIINGKSVGKISLDMDLKTVTNLLGKPSEKQKDEIIYRSKDKKDYIKIYFKNEKVIEIDFTSPSYNTTDGINTFNHGDDKYSKLFSLWKIKWLFVQVKYSLKTGGLTFYDLNVDSAENPEHPFQQFGCVHYGKEPPYGYNLIGEKNGGWKKWDGKDIYKD